MSMRSAGFQAFEKRRAVLAVASLLLLSLSPMTWEVDDSVRSLSEPKSDSSLTGVVDPWTDGGQPWPQSGRHAERTAAGPAHSPDGGAGTGIPADATELASIVDPVVNWVYGSYGIGTDALGTPVADMSAQIVTEDAAAEQIGRAHV